MAKRKIHEAFSYPGSTQSGFNHQKPLAHEPEHDANHSTLNETLNGIDQALSSRSSCHQPTQWLDYAHSEQRDIGPSIALPRSYHLDSIDDNLSPRAKMWDPVKDCTIPTPIQEDILGFRSAGGIGDAQCVDPSLHGLAPTVLQVSHGHHPYGQPQNSRHYMSSTAGGVTSTSMHPNHLAHDAASGCTVSAMMGPFPYRQSHTTVPRYYEGSAPIGLQPCHPGNPNGSILKGSQQSLSTESRLPTFEVSQRSLSQQSPQSMTLNLSTKGSPYTHQTNSHNHQVAPAPADMARASSMARYAAKLDQESNHAAAIRVYEQACALFQETIIKSSSFDERTQCNNARNTCMARLNVLSQESVGRDSDDSPGQSDQQEDDGPTGGKPQYSLFEDWTLCSKAEEDLSWQEVAEIPVFRGKRKHRSLSQRKHTIRKMGPKYGEAQNPWTTEEDRKLCALGDSGKTLGDIHRKFRSRNGERCLNRYFYVKDCQSTGRGPNPNTPELKPMSTPRNHPSMAARQSAYGLPSAYSFRSDAGDSSHLTTSMSARTMIPNALGAPSGDVSGSLASLGTVSHEHNSRLFTSKSQKSAASSSLPPTPANTPVVLPTPTTSSLSSPPSVHSPLERLDSPDGHSAAANLVQISWRTAPGPA